ncbi:hypothetical protein OQA88_12699 [Cercophora sp. LCS_1]
MAVTMAQDVPGVPGNLPGLPSLPPLPPRDGPLNTNTPPDTNMPLADTDTPLQTPGTPLDTPDIPLTRRNLARLNALNGDTRRHRHSTYVFDDDSDDTMTISTTASEFEQRAYENGLLDPPSSRPRGFNALRNVGNQRRTSTQPSEQAHQEYCDDISESYNEARASFLVQSSMMRQYGSIDRNYGRQNSRAITQIPEQDFNNLPNPLPDVLDGLKTKALPGHLHNNALHTAHSLSFCHFATELKRTDGNFHQATVQARYDGAVMVNARERALDQARRDGAATAAAIDKAAQDDAVFTLVTDGKVAEIYSHYCANEQYHQNLVACESLLEYPNRGRQLIRNFQDYARVKSYELANLLGAGLEGQVFWHSYR